MIDSTINLRIEFEGREREVELRGEKAAGAWDVNLPGGKIIGRVERTSYTYSPPLHRGSRIAREHRAVKSWRCEVGRGRDAQRGQHRQTRKAALVELIRKNGERERLMADAIEFVRSHPDALFRLRRVEDEALAIYGTLISPHPSPTLMLRLPNGPDESVRFREIEDDTRPCLDVSLDGREYVPFANPLFEFSSKPRRS